jgi:hypothetical protein
MPKKKSKLSMSRDEYRKRRYMYGYDHEYHIDESTPYDHYKFMKKLSMRKKDEEKEKD